MKAPAFQWYAADYLADERVMQLSLESEAAYVRLLNYCWREGSIPANAAQCAPMCKYADVKVIKPALALFMKSPTQPGRLIHKRLEEERAKQEEFRARQSAKGAKGGRPRKPDEKPEKPAALPGLNAGLVSVKPDESSLPISSTSSSITAVAVVGGQAADTSSSTDNQAQAAENRGPREFAYDEAPVFQMNAFFAYVDSIGYKQVDKGHYLLQIQAAGREKMIKTTDEKWRAFIRTWLNNDKRDGKLMLPYVEGQQVGRHAVVTSAAGDLTSRIEAQQKQQYVL